jgi:hypothetical protein
MTKGTVRAFAVVPAILVAAAIVIVAAAGRVAELSRPNDKAAALSFSLASSAALVDRGSRALETGKVAEAREMAHRALTLSPLDDQALELLIRTDDARREWAEERRLLSLSDRLTRRNLPLRMMILWQQSERGQLAEAVRNADLLLRQEAYPDQLFPYLRAVSVYPEARAAIARRLIARPRWRADFVGVRALEAAAYDNHLLVLRAMRGTSAPPTRAELAPFAQRLVDEGDAVHARQLRLLLAATPSSNLLLDSSIARVRTDGAGLLGWTSPIEATWIDASGRGLPLELGSSGKVLEQVVFLPSGRYILKMRTKGVPPDAMDDLQWSIGCIDRAAGPTIGPLSRRYATDQATITEQEVLVVGCPAQRLTLYSGGSTEGTAAARLLQVTLARAD